ncbi:glycine betaine ABC transporter substrate-binding protein [Natribacillus halophilus]|uniref:Glycine betaine/proline transport system substrate-binding protein n=1 Tax=Natribacillus halophilus TaxID=549003 RepID=A0A1G8KSX0_9BACI|nr:glycine betaine ABC transporter substrate-binding protein [Natribacillus halophilus]SDI46528.1 glycine betaine/proline transport system substrate-binding protein [Natribacillus halophilus]
MNKTWMRFGFVFSVSMVLLAAGCGEEDEIGNEEEGAEESSDENGEGEDATNYNEEMDYNIVGIDAGTGVMASTEDAIEDYDLDFNLQSSSDSAMAQELETAIEDEEPIVVTAWTPHWKFNIHDIKFLDDPEGSFGETEDIHTIVHPDLEEEHPEAFEMLDNFYWDEDDMGEVMGLLAEDVEPEEAGRTWVDDNEDMVAEWTEGVDEVDGENIELSSGAWESELSSTAVVQTMLEDMGYNVNVSTMELSIMWAAVAEGEAHAHVAGWLPHTAAAQNEEYGDDVVDLGPNLENARIGLAVPEYMDIDSIEDLQE